MTDTPDSMPATLEACWDHPDPFVIRHVVDGEDIDALGHTNNVCYLAWLERCAWAHSAAVGFAVDQMLAVNRAMVVRDVSMQYLLATFAGDELYIGDWISACDGRLRARRSFIDFVCIDVQRGRPTRMPPEFVAAYKVLTPEPQTVEKE